MSALVGRRSFLVGSLALALGVVGGRVVGATSRPTIAVHKSPT